MNHFCLLCCGIAAVSDDQIVVCSSQYKCLLMFGTSPPNSGVPEYKIGTFQTFVNAKPKPLYPQEGDPAPTVEEAGWVPGPVRTGAENLSSTGIRTPDRPARSVSLY